MLKFYIPVLVSGAKGGKYQLIRVDNIQKIKSLLPSKEKIESYIKLKYGDGKSFDLKTYEPLSVKVDDYVYSQILLELRRKCNQMYVENTLTVIVSSNTIPVFQIIRGIEDKKEETNV